MQRSSRNAADTTPKAAPDDIPSESFVITFLAIVAVAAGTAVGYVLGSRRHDTRAVDIASPIAQPVPPEQAMADDAEARFGAEKARIIRSRDVESAALRNTLEAKLAQGEFDAAMRDERAQIFTALADARAESARYRQLVIDIENNAPPPILSGIGEPDDLKLIVGVGPVLERMLHNLGITTFRQIGRWTPYDVIEFDAKLSEFPGRIQRDQWVTQARSLHQSKYGVSLPD
jgi:predicted flap endonuclease-1-like 5' DNA nuclease